MQICERKVLSYHYVDPDSYELEQGPNIICDNTGEDLQLSIINSLVDCQYSVTRKSTILVLFVFMLTKYVGAFEGDHNSPAIDDHLLRVVIELEIPGSVDTSKREVRDSRIVVTASFDWWISTLKDHISQR